jgi:alkanesulfonate monooxygenase SsuD/methylene tetrahydromethanopterin reductase-like flavin-dependent oxidoreductase (luciferase family)
LKVTFGIDLPNRCGFAEISRVALAAEQMGYQRAWYCDHIWSHGPECWTMLAAIAAKTHRIRLGSAVTCNLWREPTMTAKTAATVDEISAGRVEFGIGAGHTKAEYDMYGIPYPGDAERLDMLEEAIMITKSLWTNKTTTFYGKYYGVKEAFCEPMPVQRPHPPIMIGGGGLKRTPALAAKYANSYNPNADALSVKDAKLYVEALERECKKIGRDPSEIEKIWYGHFFVSTDQREVARIEYELGTKLEHTIVGSPDKCVERVKEYANLGFTHFILHTTPFYRRFLMDPVPVMRRFADTVTSQFS